MTGRFVLRLVSGFTFAVLRFLMFSFWYSTGFAILHLNEKRIALQRIPFVQRANVHRHLSAFVASLCANALHPAGPACLALPLRYQEVIDVPSCFLLDVFPKWL